MRQGLLVVMSGPSGVGKTSICERLLGMPELDARLSVSVTTRAARPSEGHGRHYDFISKAEFDRLEGEGGLLESAVVFEDHYGTPRAPVEEALRDGKTILLDIDVQGARQLREQGIDALYLFVSPPSFEVLEERLRGRKTEAPGSISRRLRAARKEMAARDEYDHCFLNDDIDRVAGEIREAILSARGLRE